MLRFGVKRKGCLSIIMFTVQDVLHKYEKDLETQVWNEMLEDVMTWMMLPTAIGEKLMRTRVWYLERSSSFQEGRKHFIFFFVAGKAQMLTNMNKKESTSKALFKHGVHRCIFTLQTHLLPVFCHNTHVHWLTVSLPQDADKCHTLPMFVP